MTKDVSRITALVYPRACGGTERIGWVVGVVVVYPRACGGTGLTCVEGRKAGGLSPRLRGNQDSAGCDS